MKESFVGQNFLKLTFHLFNHPQRVSRQKIIVQIFPLGASALLSTFLPTVVRHQQSHVVRQWIKRFLHGVGLGSFVKRRKKRRTKRQGRRDDQRRANATKDGTVPGRREERREERGESREQKSGIRWYPADKKISRYRIERTASFYQYEDPPATTRARPPTVSVLRSCRLRCSSRSSWCFVWFLDSCCRRSLPKRNCPGR